jgi:2-oxoglutarate ferredoxin oxidoreductase subunit alpha
LPIGGTTPVRQTSSSHDDAGYITSDPEVIRTSVERLKRKIESSMESATFYDLDEKVRAKALIVTYGVTARAARAAQSELLKTHDTPVNLLVLKTLWPVPETVLHVAAKKISRILVVEMNLGQYVQEVKRVLCGKRVDFFGKMSGQLIGPKEIVREIVRG